MTWLYRISTNACLRLIARRPRRLRSADYGPSRRCSTCPGTLPKELLGGVGGRSDR